MNKAKYASLLDQDAPNEEPYMRINPGFSHFNKQTEYPYETIPNVFKMSPPDVDEN